ncbi:hypothetical protein OH77DRAFT_1580262 [Trametes cingulata]|nr:hypothetical protein OH77DRAFT_1580262 [Trametes cingulata]
MADPAGLELAASALRRLVVGCRSGSCSFALHMWTFLADLFAKKDYLQMTGGPLEFESFRERIETVLQTRANPSLLLARFCLAYAQGLRQASELSLRLDGFRLEGLRERADTAVHVLRFASSGGGAALRAARQLRQEVDCLQRAHLSLPSTNMSASFAEVPNPERVFADAREVLRWSLYPRLDACEAAVLEGRMDDSWCEMVFEVLDLTLAHVRLSGHDSAGASLCARLDMLLSVAGRPSGTLIRFRMAYALAAQQAATRAAHVLRLRLSLLEGQLGATVRSLYLAGDEGATSLSAALDLLAAVCPLREMVDATALRLDRLEEQLERVR